MYELHFNTKVSKNNKFVEFDVIFTKFMFFDQKQVPVNFGAFGFFLRDDKGVSAPGMGDSITKEGLQKMKKNVKI